MKKIYAVVMFMVINIFGVVNIYASDWYTLFTKNLTQSDISATFMYSRLDALMCDYVIDMDLVRGSSKGYDVPLYIKLAQDQAEKKYILNAVTKHIEASVKPENVQNLLRSSYDEWHVISVRLDNNYSDAVVSITIKKKILNYVEVGNAYINTYYTVNKTDDTLTTTIEKSDLYDYYFAYWSVQHGYEGKFEINVKLNGNEIFSKSVIGFGGSEELVKVENLLDGNNTIVINLKEQRTTNDCAGGLRLYKKMKPLSITANPYSAVGDNSKAPINLSAEIIPGLKVQFYDYNNGNNISTIDYVAPSRVYLELPYKEGVIQIGTRLLDSNGNVVYNGQTLNINKRNILNEVLHEIKIKGYSKVLILNDTPRYFEDNMLNKQLVGKLILTGNKIYFVGDILEESLPVLAPLLER